MGRGGALGMVRVCPAYLGMRQERKLHLWRLTQSGAARLYSRPLQYREEATTTRWQVARGEKRRPRYPDPFPCSARRYPVWGPLARLSSSATQLWRCSVAGGGERPMWAPRRYARPPGHRPHRTSGRRLMYPRHLPPSIYCALLIYTCLHQYNCSASAGAEGTLEFGQSE